VGRAQDVQVINLGRLDDGAGPGHRRVFGEFQVKGFADTREQNLGIVEHRVGEPDRQDNRRRHDRPSQWSATRLIDSGHPTDARSGGE
jgi:hypothetical protein